MGPFFFFFSSITGVDISDDSSLLAYGTADSQVRVQSITPSKLRCMKSAEQLNNIDKDAGMYKYIKLILFRKNFVHGIKS